MPKESKPVVLVADDEPSTVAMLSSHLRTKGYTVLEASDGDQAWELAHEHLPNLVLLDVMMPGMSGWEVCRKIREAVSLAHTGVIMLTGIGENLNEMTSPLYGADAYLDKPFEFSDLDQKISETIERRSAGALGRADSEDIDDGDHDGDDEDDDAELVKETLRAVTARKPVPSPKEKAEKKPKAAAPAKPERAPKKAPPAKVMQADDGPKPALAKAVARPAPKVSKPPTAKTKPAPEAKKAPTKKVAPAPAPAAKPSKAKTAPAKTAKPTKPTKAAKPTKPVAKPKKKPAAPTPPASKVKKPLAKTSAKAKVTAAKPVKSAAKPKAKLAPAKAAKVTPAAKKSAKKAVPLAKPKKSAAPAKPAKKASKKR
ncbi:MAG TPA: response regulator [Polyangiaceae bacterium]|jgi:DNA-binding response OmpR family regulator|nr:response regulator [Polyangiaceae bacterium]